MRSREQKIDEQAHKCTGQYGDSETLRINQKQFFKCDTAFLRGANEIFMV